MRGAATGRARSREIVDLVNFKGHGGKTGKPVTREMGWSSDTTGSSAGGWVTSFK